MEEDEEAAPDFPGAAFDRDQGCSRLHLALHEGVQDELKERLDHTTFTEGLPVSDHHALAEVAIQVGLDEVEIKEVLTSDTLPTLYEPTRRRLGPTASPPLLSSSSMASTGSGAQPSDVQVPRWNARGVRGLLSLSSAREEPAKRVQTTLRFLVG